MKEQYPWAFEIDEDRLKSLKAAEEMEKQAAPAPASAK